ncbi:MAG: signal peptidase II [Pelagibacteraceae bacterium]|mgnify:CR=1 FL=1|nr:signal peptidase II [Pelagibacteraceae bacterium]OUV89420.1 MAG: signal peptidase II [Pelagibacteraceae bacterium TMED146]RZO91530.1 MAG: signal peptidase II [alpha proteobacterium HIMB114]
MKEKIAQLRNKILLSIFIITICFLTDRISKIYVINYFIQNNLSDLYINPYLNLILLWNKGIAFGLLESESFFYNFLSILIFMIIVFIIYLIFKSEKKFEIVCFSMISGGAIGNFIDRLYYNAVPDFIDINYKGFHWFTFNIADIWITLGIVTLLSFEIISDIKKK